MKNSHTCPKCGGTDIVRCKTKSLGQSGEIPAGLFDGAPVSRWVCCTCGYCELWVDHLKWLEKLKASWSAQAGGTENET